MHLLVFVNAAQVLDSQLVIGAKRVVDLDKASAVRYLTLLNTNDGLVLSGRDGTFPSAFPGSHIKVWRNVTEDLRLLEPFKLTGMDMLAHNFALTYDGHFDVFGGLSQKGTVNLGIRHATAATLDGLEKSSLILKGKHAGCQEHVWDECQFDGKLSAVKLENKTFIYARLNTGRHKRFVQVTSGPPYEPFRPIQVQGWTPCDVYLMSIYYIAVVPNPVDPNTVLAFFPVHTLAHNDCYIAVAISSDGYSFSAPRRVLDNVCAPMGRVTSMPVDGIVGSYFYIQHSVPMPFTTARDTFDPHVARYEFSLTELAAWTRNFTVHADSDAASCKNPTALATYRNYIDAYDRKHHSGTHHNLKRPVPTKTTKRPKA